MARKKKTDAVYIPSQPSSEKKVAQGNGGETVTVALCHPHGIRFMLDGGKRSVVINGNAANLVGMPMGKLPRGGFGLTTIQAADWEQIKTLYSGLEVFKNGLIFAHGKGQDVRAEADEKAELRHGLEPVEVEGAGRNTRSEPMEGAAI